MAKILGFQNEKGGVGKTTACIMMAEYSAIVKDKPTLLVGMDPQANMDGKYLNVEEHPISKRKQPPIHPNFDSLKKDSQQWDGRSSSASVILATASETELITYPTNFDKLSILPVDGHKLAQLEIYRNQKLINDITFQLSNWLQLPAIQEAYDLIIIDSPPTRGIFTIATSNALTHLVIPIEPTKFSLDGLESQVNEWYQSTIMRPEEHPIELVGVFPNKVRHNVKKEKDILAALRNHPSFGKLIFPIEAHLRKDIQDACEPLYDTRDPDTLELRKSINQYKSIFNYPDNNKAKKEMIAVCDYIYKEIFNG